MCYSPTPLLHALRRAYPQAEITYAVGAWSRPMIATSQDIDEIIVIPDRWTPGSFIAAARVFRARQFDIVFVPERTPVPDILVWLAGSRSALDSTAKVEGSPILIRSRFRRRSSMKQICIYCSRINSLFRYPTGVHISFQRPMIAITRIGSLETRRSTADRHDPSWWWEQPRHDISDQALAA